MQAEKGRSNAREKYLSLFMALVLSCTAECNLSLVVVLGDFCNWVIDSELGPLVDSNLFKLHTNNIEKTVHSLNR